MAKQHASEILYGSMRKISYTHDLLLPIHHGNCMYESFRNFPDRHTTHCAANYEQCYVTKKPTDFWRSFPVHETLLFDWEQRRNGFERPACGEKFSPNPFRSDEVLRKAF